MLMIYDLPPTSSTISSVLSIVGEKVISTVTAPWAGTTPRDGSTRKQGLERSSRTWNSKSIGT